MSPLKKSDGPRCMSHMRRTHITSRHGASSSSESRSMLVAEHAFSPVLRAVAVAWLARVALRDEERAA